MSDENREPIATIALIAALADGTRSAEEEQQLNQLTEAIGGSNFDAIARQVLSGQVKLEEVAGKLTNDESRRQAYEMAVLVCHADGTANEKEQAFLANLKRVLKVDATALNELDAAAAGLAVAPITGPPPVTGSSPAAGPAASPADRDAAISDMIMKNAMLAGALEIFPQNLASLAIVPLQLRLVYRIGGDFGQKLDVNQVKDLAGAVGIGAAAQVMEGVARRMIGGLAKGLFGRILGGAAGGAAGAAAGVGLTFASTYALGHAAKQYYAQGRTLSRDDLKALFTKLRGEAGTIYPKVEAEIKQQSASLNLSAIIGKLKAAV